MLEPLLSIIAPHYCCGCGKIGSLLCQHCENNIMTEPHDVCMNCGKAAQMNGLCSTCKPVYTSTWVVGSYQETLGALVRQVKFDGARAGLSIAARLIAERLPDLPTNTCIVPIPTIRRHIRLRGFDHTARIARDVAHLKAVSVAPSLARNNNSVQVGASRRVREQQARSAFSPAGAIDPAVTYLLLDDVVTTGASMRAAASTLRAGGAQTIWAVCLARETLDYRGDI